MFFSPYLDIDDHFDAISKQLLEASWLNVHNAANWWHVLPTPNPPDPPIGLTVLGGQEGLNQIDAQQRYRAVYWEHKAKAWFDDFKLKIGLQEECVRTLVRQRIINISKPYGELLATDRVAGKWLITQSQLSLKSFIGLNITPNVINTYVTPLVIEERKKHELGEPTQDIDVTFSGLLNEPDKIDVYINILRKVGNRKGKVIIDDIGNFYRIRGNISILCAWIEVLQQLGKFKSRVSDHEMAKRLNNHFPGLNLNVDDPSILRKTTDTRNKYHAEFLQLMQ